MIVGGQPITSMMNEVEIGAESAIAVSGMPRAPAIGKVIGRISAVAAELDMKLDMKEPSRPEPANTTIQLWPSSSGRNWSATHLPAPESSMATPMDTPPPKTIHDSHGKRLNTTSKLTNRKPKISASALAATTL